MERRATVILFFIYAIPPSVQRNLPRTNKSPNAGKTHLFTPSRMRDSAFRATDVYRFSVVYS